MAGNKPRGSKRRAASLTRADRLSSQAGDHRTLPGCCAWRVGLSFSDLSTKLLILLPRRSVCSLPTSQHLRARSTSCYLRLAARANPANVDDPATGAHGATLEFSLDTDARHTSHCRGSGSTRQAASATPTHTMIVLGACLHALPAATNPGSNRWPNLCHPDRGKSRQIFLPHTHHHHHDVELGASSSCAPASSDLC